MNKFLHGVARAVAETIDLPEPILEVGSYQVAGQENIINLRALFPDKEYLGVDMRPGPGVDEVADVESLPYASGTFGTVIAMSTFEHVPHFWRGFEEVRRVLRPNGVLFVSTPFYFHIHAYPSDYWRFTPAAFELLLRDYPNRILGWHGPKTRPANVWAVACREDHPGFTPDEFAKYKSLLKQYAREPLPWQRRLRYQLGALICGRRPFAPHLQREKWVTEIRTSPVYESTNSYESESDIVAVERA
jgi:SAM-dependent methyltransferase